MLVGSLTSNQQIITSNHQSGEIPLVIKYTDTEDANGFLKNNAILIDISKNKLSSIEFINDNVQFDSSMVGSLTSNHQIHIKIKFDIVKSIFDIISRKEEFESDKRDKHNRYIPDESNLISKPIVNYYISLLFNLIQFVSRNTGQPLLQKWYWPHGENSAICLTHDVDKVDKWSFNRGSLITLYGLCKANFNLLYDGYKHISNSFTKSEENYSALPLFDKIISIEKKFKVKSSFYFATSLQWIYETQNKIENIYLRIYYPLNNLHTKDINIFGADVNSIDFSNGIVKINLSNIERKLVVKLTGTKTCEV
jgi:hypothetical protein